MQTKIEKWLSSTKEGDYSKGISEGDNFRPLKIVLYIQSSL